MKTQTKYPIIKCNKMLIRVVKELLKRKVAKSSFRYHNRIKLRIILLRTVLPNQDGPHFHIAGHNITISLPSHHSY